MPHAEGLAGQHTAHNDALEQIAFLKGRHQESHTPLPAQGADSGLIVDIIHPGLDVAGHEILNECVNGAHGQRGNGMFKAEHIGHMGACQRKGLLFCIAEADACRVGITPRDEGQQHGTAVHIEKDTVDFGPNFDETKKEPIVLPSRFPNLLVNGSTGIAVGMATNIPPHNLREVIDAAVCVLDNPEADLADLMQYPDAGNEYVI